ncbi:hypothetical protein DSM106972_044490 [Dulcicalothrix desertica PCC 7102]|uniref:DUF3102 domain-containing protein n=1 Tax=Dulcicalothrix desertica PCC 7102 TaxID=232991 RepID=A0A433VDP9_9CYAN|nr:DUF3102 domain-containing protein [Dulcicalothrix desertica]RUT04221.1 hypothetical protein DSM106972_044490 [Dulcicalothrix desertica PCC 7102]TWH51476.1 Protein of unknown function (DUF3102) [Dulcicalothrix desertica PCC 7102]
MKQDNLCSQPLTNLSTEQTLNFEYGLLESETQLVVQQRATEIKMLVRRSYQDIIDIGQKLIEVKQHLGHGNFRNWLQFEFNWSVSTATKFMQVALHFKCVNFTHLNIAVSSLYLLAAPSTPSEARIEVLERASNGENISYSKAKSIVNEYKKTIDIIRESNNRVKVIKPLQTTTETHSLSSPELEMNVVLKEKQSANTIKDIYNGSTQTLTAIKDQVAISHISDTALNEIAISIKSLTPEQLAKIIIIAANTGLSKSHLSAIITASQQVLNA